MVSRKPYIMKNTSLLFVLVIFFPIHIFAQPIISSFSPVSGPVGTTVTISGTGFNLNANSNVVFFGSVRANVVAASTTTLAVVVPAYTSYRRIAVTANGLTGYSKSAFTTTFPGGGALSPTSFLPRVDFPPVAQPVHYTPLVSLGLDMDSDGKPEMISFNAVFSNNTYHIGIAKNNSTPGNILFAPQIYFPNPSYPYYLDYGDFDGDGRPDLVSPDDFGDSVAIFKNTSGSGLISIAPAKSFSADGAYATVVDDFDGDGLPDMACTSNSTSRKFSLHRNTSFGGLISFAAKVSYLSAGTPRGITTGFINDDNKPDIVISNQGSSSISIFINVSSPGNIVFLPAVNFFTSAGSRNEGIRVVDIDNDGKQDVVVVNFNNANTVSAVSVFRNISTSTVNFEEKKEYPTGLDWYSFILDINDLDGDGNIDLAVSHFGVNVVSVFRNKSIPGLISFDAKQDYSTIDQARYLFVNDMDGDGKPDLISNYYQNSVGTGSFSVFKNSVENPNIRTFFPSDGCSGAEITIKGTNFSGTTSVTFGSTQASSFTVLSDTAINAFVGTGSTGAVFVTTTRGTGTGGGTFTYTGTCIQAPEIDSIWPVSTAAGSPITIYGRYFNSAVAQNIVYFGAAKASVNSASTNQLIVTVPEGATNRPITVTSNALTAFSPTPFYLSFNEAENCEAFTSNSFALKQDFITGTSPYSVGIVQIEDDNLSEVVTANFTSENFTTLKNLSVGKGVSFVAETPRASGINPISTNHGDFDNDGKQDQVILNFTSNTVSIFRNTSIGGTISYASKVDLGTGNNPRNISVNDVNVDGKADIIFSNSADNTFTVLRNTSSAIGTITFAAPVSFATGSSPTGVCVLDINNDKKPDVVVSNLQSNTVSVFKNISSSNNIIFDTKIDYETGTQPASIFLNDLNGDLKPDIIVANHAVASVSILRNLSLGGNLIFSSKKDFQCGQGPFSITAADLNADGKPDITVANVFDNTVSVLRNVSTGDSIMMEQKQDYSVGSNPRSVAVGDINGDGKADIVTANTSDNSISVLLNTFTSYAGQACAGGSTTLIANITGGGYQWQLNTGTGFLNISENSNYIGTNTKFLQLSSIPSTWNGYGYRCLVAGLPTETFTLTIINKWLGTVDSNWETAANWSCGEVPDANTDVIISCGGIIHINSNVTCRSISLNQNALCVVKPGFVLTLTN